MSIDNVQLSPLIVGEWYKDALLASPDGPPAIQRPVQAQPLASAMPAQPPPGTLVQPPVRPVQPAVTAPPAKPVESSIATKTEPAAPASPQPAAPSKPAVPQPLIPMEPAPMAQPAAPSQAAPSKPPAAKAEPPAPASPATAPPGYKFLGNNRRQITIVVHSPGSAFLPDNQLSFLTKILEACRMNIGDVAIVNAATTPVAIAELRQQLKPSSILLFGLEPVAIKLPINFPVFRLQPYDDCTYLSAPSLSQLVQSSEESKLLKSKLWVCLKTLFNV